LKEAGINDTVNMVTFPEAKNKLLIRIENNADIYDPDATTRFVDLNQLAYALY